MPEIRLLYFASVRAAIGLSEERLTVPAQVDDQALLRLIAARHPAAASVLACSRVALEQEFARGLMQIAAEAEVAIIPPVSGG